MRSSEFLSWFCIVTFAVVLASDAPAAEKRSTLDVKEAGPAYRIQGEYTGTLTVDYEDVKVGIQVYAWPESKGGPFKATGYRGGLPGDGWDREMRVHFAGKTEGKKTVLEQTGGDPAPDRTFRLTIEDQKMTVEEVPGGVVGTLERVVRKSPTLGKKPPEGALVLFDGTTGEHFRTKSGKPVQVTEDGYLKVYRGSGGLFTQKKFQGCRVHLEFLLPFEPLHDGQGRANSGFYLQGRYEVQILDSFGLKGLENQCGGVYSSGKNPRENMCFPPLTWQTFDVEFKPAEFGPDGEKPAHLTVYHNGVLVYDDLTIDHDTTASPYKEGPEPMEHYLQDHGHDILFRNIWVVEK